MTNSFWDQAPAVLTVLASVVAALTALASFLTALTVLLRLFKVERTGKDNAIALADNTAKTVKIYHIVNSRLDELLQATREASHASGVAQGVEYERQRQTNGGIPSLDPPPPISKAPSE